jgi:regulation of enolase protein 1 (concanavalin A-like superfamily)
MTNTLQTVLAFVLLTAMMSRGDEVVFEDNFNGKLGPGWLWVRENPAAWRATERGLEVRVEPGNLWGEANNAKNVLLRKVPDPTQTPLEISVKVENRPTEQYEQVNLVWYYSDSHMVKIGQEIVNGKLTVVMGREENDSTRTIAIIPLDSHTVWLRLRVQGNRIHGGCRTSEANHWTVAGSCKLPVQQGTAPNASLHFYQGPQNVEHWARVTEFRIRKITPDK